MVYTAVRVRQWIARHTFVLFVLAFLIPSIAMTWILALIGSLNISESHLDGAYQTASSLYRMSVGQVPGRDFFPYLGAGLVYFLYPLFWWVGGSFSASQFTAAFFPILAGAFRIGWIGSMLVSRQRSVIFILLGAFILAVLPFVSPEYHFFFMPGNSLRPLRSFLPYLCAPFVYVLIRSKLGATKKYCILGAIAGLCLIWSNDYAIPTATFLLLFGLLWAQRGKQLSAALFWKVSACFILVAVLTYFIATGGHPLELLQYNFLDVPGDNYWYPGPWSAPVRILSFYDAFPKFLGETSGWVLVLLGLMIADFVKPSLEKELLLFVGFCMYAGGLIASIGGHLYGYFFAFLNWSKYVFVLSLFVGVSQLAKWIVGVAQERKWLPSLDLFKNHFKWIPRSVAGLLWLGLLYSTWTMYGHYSAMKAFAQQDANRFYVEELGGYLPVQWRTHVDFARSTRGRNILEEYWGIWSSVNRTHAKLPVDSVIHALGSHRPSFIRAIKDMPEFVITSPYSMSPEWQPFCVSAHWWFYQTLFEHYTPTQTSPSTLVWKKTEPNPWQEAICRVDALALPPRFVIQDATPGLYEVKLEYQNKGLGRRTLLMVQNNLNFAVDAEGYLSINPKEKSSLFPVVVKGSGDQAFDFRLITAGDDWSKVEIQKCHARKALAQYPGVLPEGVNPKKALGQNLPGDSKPNAPKNKG